MLEKVWYFDVRTSKDEEVINEVRKLWIDFELGNDHYMLRMSINDILEPYPPDVAKTPLVNYLRQHNIDDDEPVIIHWWW